MTSAPITARQLNRATLARQLLLRRQPLGVVEAVRRVVALQAQEPASPYLSLWNRLSPFDPSDLDRAFADHAIVKASLMRITLHAVGAADYPTFHAAMQRTLRAARLNDARFTRTGLIAADADALIPGLLAFAAVPRRSDGLEAWVDEQVGVRPKPGVWWALRHYSPLVHAPTGGPWSFGPRNAYVASRLPPVKGDPDQSLPGLARRYLEGFGPATAADLAQFGLLQPRARVRAALMSLIADGTAVILEGPDGTELFDVPGGEIPPEDTPAPPRLMPMWDSILLAYADRGRVIPPDYRKLVIRNNGDVLPSLLVDGHVAGVWRPVDDGIEATAFHRLPREAWAGLASEARALVAFLADREPAVYRRYARWWSHLEGAEVRLLPG